MRWTFRPWGNSRRSRFANREFAFQLLYKAQNLGFYKSIYEGETIKRCLDAVALADAYSEQTSFARAKTSLRDRVDPEEQTLFTKFKGESLILALPSNLEGLGLVSDAINGGWNVTIEDCPFSQRFVRPVAQRSIGKSIHFAPFIHLPVAARKLAQKARRNLLITFPDRPFDSIRGSVEVRLLGKAYLLSIAEPLLTRAGAEGFFRWGDQLEIVQPVANSVGLISGEELASLVQRQAASLEAAILKAPYDYLGWHALYSRSRLYFELVRANVRSLYQSLLRYSQSHDIALTEAGYRGMLVRLENAGPRRE